MINLGTVRPGSTIYIPFESFASSTGAPITLTGLATTDILVYKDGGVTQRASDAGFTLLDTDGIDFDGLTGIHGVSISLADNTTADFWAAGSRYFVVIGPVTVDSQTMRFIAASFMIGYEGAILDTTLATLTNQTSFTLTAGSADDNAYNGCVAVIHDAASAIQVAMGVISAYTGASKTVTLAADPGIFTMAAKDNISIFPRTNVAHAGGVAWASGAITAAVIATDAVDADALADNAITAATFAAGAITATVIADGAIDAATFAAGAITATVIADGAIDAATFAAGAIDAAAIADNAIDAGAIAADAITAAKIATGAIDADALATDAVNEIADGFLDRNMTTGTDSGSTTVRTPRQALRFLRNKWSISGTTLTVTKEDDATSSWTSTITATAGADPITANDPAGP